MVHNFDEIVSRRGTDSKKYAMAYLAGDVIPMWLADTDFKSPQPVIDALEQRLAHGILGYPVSSERLKRAAAHWLETRFCYHASPAWVEYTPGVIAGIDFSIQALSEPGDGVILQTPAYPPFSQGIELNGRVLVPNPLVLRQGRYEIDFESFEAACRRPDTKLFILCSPQNPTGRVFSREELARMGDICLENGVVVLSDEIHSDIVFPPHRHTVFASLGEKYSANCVTFINPSKTFNIPGLRTAALIAEDPAKREAIHRQIMKVKAVGETVFGTLALCTAYESCAYYADQEVAYMAGNLALARQAFEAIPSIDLIEPEGTFLFWLDCRKTGLTQDALMKRFVETARVGVKDGADFGPDGVGFVRMTAAVPRAVLEEVLDRITKAFTEPNHQ